jgi:adenosylcobinamide-GDP ribazoletransferase
MAYFAPVGMAIGTTLGMIWRLARRRLGPLPAAVVVVAADAALTGALHLDGLADTTDGLFAHTPRATRLSIMADPAVGSFGAVALITALVARAVSLAEGEPSIGLLAGLWGLSRATMVVETRHLDYVSGTAGLAQAFLPQPDVPDRSGVAALAGGAASLCLLVATQRRAGLRAGLASLAGSGLVAGLAARRIGGFTGDVLGASGVVGETAGLLAAVLR